MIGELLVADYTRKGYIDGRSLRLPGVVARTADASGAVSAFMSDLIREVSAGHRFVCPVSGGAVSWWMSRDCCADNLLHGLMIGPDELTPARTWLLYPLRASMAEVVAAIGRVHHVDAKALVRYEPVESVEARFGTLPAIHLPASERLGFSHDGTVDEMVRRALL